MNIPARTRTASTRPESEAVRQLNLTHIESNAQLRLTSILQTTIEMQPLFELFFGQMQHLVKIDSCHYWNKGKRIDVKLGTSTTHSCEYSLNIQKQFIGNLTLSRKLRFAEEELAQIESLIATLIYPLRNALSYHDAINQALSDPLTGLGNRSSMETALEHEWQLCQRYEQEMAVLMVDIDHFKSINDRLGHDVGDHVIKRVAKTINDTTRQTDLAFRYGGEEFMVILSKTNVLGAEVIAERIRENIAKLQLSDEKGRQVAVTASVGGCSLERGMSKSTLMKMADNSMYKAKAEGRNKVVFFNRIAQVCANQLSI